MCSKNCEKSANRCRLLYRVATKFGVGRKTQAKTPGRRDPRPSDSLELAGVQQAPCFGGVFCGVQTVLSEALSTHKGDKHVYLSRGTPPQPADYGSQAKSSLPFPLAPLDIAPSDFACSPCRRHARTLTAWRAPGSLSPKSYRSRTRLRSPPRHSPLLDGRRC